MKRRRIKGIPSLPFPYPIYHFNIISTTPNHLYNFYSSFSTIINHHQPSSSTSFGRIINISGTFFVFKSIFLTCIFAFNHIIPLYIVSFYSFSHLITMHPKDRKSLFNALFIGGKRVEGNSNALSSLQNE